MPSKGDIQGLTKPVLDTTEMLWMPLAARGIAAAV